MIRPLLFLKISEAATSGERVTLVYEQALMRSRKEGDTAYLIVGVKSGTKR
jgi:hypothetical protein